MRTELSVASTVPFQITSANPAMHPPPTYLKNHGVLPLEQCRSKIRLVRPQHIQERAVDGLLYLHIPKTFRKVLQRRGNTRGRDTNKNQEISLMPASNPHQFKPPGSYFEAIFVVGLVVAKARANVP